jgi:uncharacterized protein YecT (DUF1311 family)
MSNRRDYIAEIRAKRARDRPHAIAGSLRLHTLSDAFERTRNDDELRRYFPVAVIAVVEGFVRHALRRLVDEKAGSLDAFLRSAWAKDQKFDLTILQAVAGREITVGELISHLVPVKSLENIDAGLSAALGQSFRGLLASVHDRWAVEVEGKPKTPMISDVDGTFAALAGAFRQRHILAHEPAEGLKVSEAEVRAQLQSAAAFIAASDELVNSTIAPDEPLTQTEMNVRAANRVRELETRLEAALDKAKTVLDQHRASLLDRSQNEWEVYRDTQADNEGRAFEGGSIRPLIEGGARETLTKARLADVERLLVNWEEPPDA